MSEKRDDHAADVEMLLRRVELLERENERLRRKIEPVLGPDNPCFDAHLFQRVLRRTLLICTVPLYLILPSVMALALISPPNIARAGPIPLIDVAGSSTGIRGIGLGIVAVGGASLGVIAVGGMGIGLVAIGGGTVGVFAVGGGSAGLVALGGGAAGYIAIGGNAFGWYALGQRAHGRYALGMNRQDPEAIAFFAAFVPGLRNAVTTPMPVIPLQETAAAPKTFEARP